MRVVIPGGTGFIGGRIAEHLRSHGYEVRVSSRRARPWAGPSTDISVIPVDWRNQAALDAAVAESDALIMLAAANEIESARDPVGAADATATQCLAWLQAAQRQGVRRFLYMSTIHVYGRMDGMVVDEETTPRPVHPYATTHLAAELFVQAAHRSGQTSGTIFRLSNAFGAPVDPAVDRWSLLVNDLARQAVQTGQLNLFTDGTQSRDFIGLEAVCAAVRIALEQSERGSEATVFNLASGQMTTVYNMACRIAERAGRMLGAVPGVSRVAPDARKGPVSPGRFDISRLMSSGIDVRTDTDREIDQLLGFCIARTPQIDRA